MYCSHFFVSLQQINNKLKPQKRYLTMKKLFLPILLMVTVSAHAAENPVLTIEGGQVQGVLADDHPRVASGRPVLPRIPSSWCLNSTTRTSRHLFSVNPR